MKFLIDENEFKPLIDPLRMILPHYEFHHVYDLNLGGTLDLPLFSWMKDNRYTAIITQDGAQLDNRDERQALIESGTHWIGRKQLKNLAGMRLVSTAVATYVAAFPHILEELEQAIEPMLLRVMNVQAGKQERVKASPLRA
ncbi:MAG: hypothetical protein HLX51_05960 [Micrococcaceae bacterium]|nr:hypothetical protein [Micrococcaceae bacterium]